MINMFLSPILLVKWGTPPRSAGQGAERLTIQTPFAKSRNPKSQRLRISLWQISDYKSLKDFCSLSFNNASSTPTHTSSRPYLYSLATNL